MSAWRSAYAVYPAADVFPMMSDEELDALGQDIKATGLKVPLSFCWVETGTPTAHRVLIDGRNRLEAMERVGIRLRVRSNGLPESLHGKETATIIDGDPVAYIISANIRRRHLTPQQQLDLIVAVRMAVNKPGHDDPVSRGGRGKVNPVKAAVIADAMAAGLAPSESTVKRAIAKAGLTPEQIAARRQKASRRAKAGAPGLQRGAKARAREQPC